MRITVPYTYEAEARNSAGTIRKNDIDASFEVEVPEVDPADAPVVLRHAGFFNQRPTGETRVGHGHRPAAGPLADVRLVRGRLYEQVVWVEDGERSAATIDDLASPASLFRDMPEVAKRADAPDARYWSEAGKTVYVRTRRKEALEAVREAVDLVSVAGVLHRASPEPVLVFPKQESPYRPVDRTMPVVGRTSRYMHSATFRLDDADLAARLALARGAAPARAATVAAMVEVVDPSALSADLRDHAIRDAGRRLTESASMDLHHRRLETMLAYADLRDATTFGREESDPVAVATTMADYCAAVDAEPTGTGKRRIWEPHRAVLEARIEMEAYARQSPGIEADHDMADFFPAR